MEPPRGSTELNPLPPLEPEVVETPVIPKPKLKLLLILVGIIAVAAVAVTSFLLNRQSTPLQIPLPAPTPVPTTSRPNLTIPTASLEALALVLDANQLISSTVGISTGGATVLTSAPSSFPFHIDSTLSRFNLVVAYEGIPGSVDLILLDPKGNQADTPECNLSGTESICLLSVDASTGDWTLQAVAARSDTALMYRVNGFPVENTITYTGSINSLTGDMIEYPEPIVLAATITKVLPISGAVVNANVKKPNGTNEPIALLDNGIAPDARASDGMYSAILDYDQNGSYNITVQFDNSAGTAEMTSLSYLPAPPPPGEKASPRLPIPVEENFERFARLQVNVVGVRSDDHGNDLSAATVLPVDNTDVPGRIDYAGDIDAFVVTATKNGELVLRVFNFALGMDPQLQVLAGDMTTVIADVDLTTNASSRGYVRVPLSVSAGEIIYALVSDKNTATGGLYDINAGARIYGD